MSDEDVHLWVIVGAATACIVYYLFKIRQAASPPTRGLYDRREHVYEVGKVYYVTQGDERDNVTVHTRTINRRSVSSGVLSKQRRPYEACKKDVAFQRFMKKLLPNQ